ncbi:MAG: ATP-binding protein [Chloroflexota bacterium]|nr:ATP-binding protein [Chloroflexota bacterium]
MVSPGDLCAQPGDVEESQPTGSLLADAEAGHTLQTELRELRQRVKEQELVIEISHIMSESLDPQQVLKRMLQEVNRALDTQAASVLLVDEATGELVFQVADSPGIQEVTTLRLKPGQGVAGWAAQYGLPVLLSDASQDPRFYRGIDATTGLTTRDLLCVPLLVKGRVIGVLEVMNKTTGRLDESDLRLVTALAPSAAIAIENARLHRTVREEHCNLESILHSIADGVYTTDFERRITSYSPSAQKITGWPAALAVDRFCGDVLDCCLTGEERCNSRECILLQALNQRRLIIQQGQMRVSPGGEEKLLAVLRIAAPLMNEWGEVRGMVGAFWDVSHQAELERMKADFLSMIFHELRAPLSNISASVEMLLHSSLDEEARREIMEIIGSQSARLNRFVQEVLEAARLESHEIRLNLQPLTMGPLVREVMDSFLYPVATHRFQVHAPEGLPFINGDRDKVETILRNLIGNAMNYSTEGTVINISVEERDKGVLTTVSDEGVGITPGDLDRIFDRFYRVESSSPPKVQGTGLGLYIAKLLVEAHGGDMVVESQVGVGSRFGFLLPKLEPRSENDDDPGH